MNPDVDRPDIPKRNLDDEQLGVFVRSVADEWRMPPQRLDQPTWPYRIRPGQLRGRPWLVRLAGPAFSALVATVVLAVAAVWLTAPRSERGIGQTPPASVEPSASTGPAHTPLPKLVRNGPMPSVTRVMVLAEGRYRLADLTTGTLGADTLGSYSGPTALVPRAGGGWLCVCGTWTAFGINGATGLSLTLVSLDAGGSVRDRTEVRRIDGTADPNQPSALQFQLVDASISVAPNNKTVFFVWTSRNGGPGWISGVDVIDVASGAVVSTRDLAVDQPPGTAGKPISRNAPSVKLSPAGDRILMAGFWFVEDPSDPNPPAGTDRWTASFDGRAIGAITSLAGSTADECGEFDNGLIDSNSYYLICAAQFGELTVRRLQLHGSSIGDTPVARTEEEFSGGSLVARSGDGLYIWDPVAAVLSRVDLGTGALTQSPAAGVSDAGPFDRVAALGHRVGRWIAPSVAAKVLLEPGIVLSPDGTRLFAIGVTAVAPSGRGSTGVFAFDAASLARISQWTPTADFTSIAVSSDGRFVYAAAQGGVDASGARSRNGSSVTVFDASDGSVRLIAGQLGSADLWFPTPTLE